MSRRDWPNIQCPRTMNQQFSLLLVGIYSLKASRWTVRQCGVWCCSSLKCNCNVLIQELWIIILVVFIVNQERAKLCPIALCHNWYQICSLTKYQLHPPLGNSIAVPWSFHSIITITFKLLVYICTTSAPFLTQDINGVPIELSLASWWRDGDGLMLFLLDYLTVFSHGNRTHEDTTLRARG